MVKRTSLTDLIQKTNADSVRRAQEIEPKAKKQTGKQGREDQQTNKRASQTFESPGQEAAKGQGGIHISAVEKNKTEEVQEIVKTTIYLPIPVVDQLRSLQFDEQKGKSKRIKLHDYFLEGLNLLFKNRGLKSIEELIYEADK